MASSDSMSVFAEGTFEEQVIHCWDVAPLIGSNLYFLDSRTCKLCSPQSIRWPPCCFHQTISRYFEDGRREKIVRRRWRPPEKDFFDGFEWSKRVRRWLWERCTSLLCISRIEANRQSEIEGFFNLLYSHLFALYPAHSPEAKQYLTVLLQTISTSPSEQAPIKYRMYEQSLHIYHSFSYVTCF